MQSRGLSSEVLREFNVGYALSAWDCFKNAGRDFLPPLAAGGSSPEKFSYHEMEGAGLLNYSPKKKGYYDTFRGRIMFPFMDHRSGQCIGFVGGACDGSDESLSRNSYLFSRDSSVRKFREKITVFKKETLVFGLFQAKEAIANSNEVYVVEDYLDVLSLAQSGIRNVVSVGAFNRKRANLLKQHTDNVLLVYGDDAGIRAMLQRVDVLLSVALNVKIVSLAKTKCPYEFIQRYGAEALRNYLQDNRLDFVIYKATNVLRNLDSTNKGKRIRSMARTLGYISSISLRETYIKECVRVGASEDELRKELSLHDSKRKELTESKSSRRSSFSRPGPKGGQGRK